MRKNKFQIKMDQPDNNGAEITQYNIYLREEF